MTVVVKRYKNAKDYEKDAGWRLATGWNIASQSQETGRTQRLSRAGRGAVVGSLFGFPLAGAVVGGMSGKREEGPITVTWTWSPPSGPPVGPPPGWPR